MSSALAEPGLNGPAVANQFSEEDDKQQAEGPDESDRSVKEDETQELESEPDSASEV